MVTAVNIRPLADADRRIAAHIYAVGFLDEEVRPLMPRHVDRAEGIFAELIQPGPNSWVAASDAGEVVAVALCQEPPWPPPSVVSWSIYRRHLPVVATARARLVAQYLYRVRFTEDALYLQSLVVAPEWQRQGVGHALVRFVCREAQARGYARVTLNAVVGNEPAHRLYEHLGFSKVQTTPAGFYRHLVGWEGVDSMEKRLQSAQGGAPVGGEGSAAETEVALSTSVEP